MRDARKMLAIPSLRSLQILSPRPSEGAKVTLLHFFCKKISLDTLLLRFSQKITQAELFASAHFVRIFMTPPFLLENGYCRFLLFLACSGKTLPFVIENAMGVFLLYGRFFLFRKKSRKLNFLRVLASLAIIRI